MCYLLICFIKIVRSYNILIKLLLLVVYVRYFKYVVNFLNNVIWYFVVSLLKYSDFNKFFYG